MCLRRLTHIHTHTHLHRNTPTEPGLIWAAERCAENSVSVAFRVINVLFGNIVGFWITVSAVRSSAPTHVLAGRKIKAASNLAKPLIEGLFKC